MLKRQWLLIVFWVFAAMPANAQYSGAIRGRVVDPQGHFVAGATLKLTGSELPGWKTAVSNDIGAYIFLGLPPGVYQLEAAQKGFHAYTQPGIILRAGWTLVLDLRLTVMGMAQTIDVTARGGGKAIPIIDISNPEHRFNVSGEFVNRLPLSSRQNWEGVWFLVPGAVTIGQRSNVYKMDGFESGNAFTNQGWTTQFSTGAIQDVQIKTSGSDAPTSLGQGGYINIITKSGGNQFHGAASFFSQPRSFSRTSGKSAVTAGSMF